MTPSTIIITRAVISTKLTVHKLRGGSGRSTKYINNSERDICQW